MVSGAHPHRRQLRRPRHESATGTLVALLLSTLVPVTLAAVALGWRPPMPAFGPWRTLLHGQEADPPPAAALPGSALPQGWFFPAASGDGTGARGFAVTDADPVPMWTTFQELGGIAYLGFPLSQRYESDGQYFQLFQRALLRGDPSSGAVVPTALLDQLHAAGFDEQLAAQWMIPPIEVPAEGEPTGDQWTERLDWLLGDYPALRQYVNDAPAARRLFGLPTSAVHDAGGFYIVRFQKGALQLWKEDVAWAAAGTVTPVNVGEIAVALGYLGSAPLVPEPAPSSR